MLKFVMDSCGLLLLALFTMFVLRTTCQPSYDGNYDMSTLSRRKRYIVFPEGTTFSIAFCVTWTMLTNDPDIYTTAVNWAVSYDLPNQTYRSPRTLRRHRRELYERLEVAMDSAGVDGRTCIKRALCEAPQQLRPKSSLAEELVRMLFTFPLEHVDVYEPMEHHIYDAAHRRGLSDGNCPGVYKSCPFSLIDVFLGVPEYE